MTSEDALVLKAALSVLKKVGSMGLPAMNLVEQAEFDSGILLSTIQREALWKLICDRRYVISYREPVTNRERWTITERGLDALGCL